MWWNNLKMALRSLKKHKASTLINMLGLTLGVTACLSIYTITRFELSYDTFHPDLDRMYRVVGRENIGQAEEFSPVGFGPRAMAAAIEDEISGLEAVASFHNIEMPVTVPDGSGEPKRFERSQIGAEPAAIVVVAPAYFELFQYEWLAGKPELALEMPGQVVLTENKARLYFGEQAAQAWIGKELIYGDDIRVTVTGIVKDWTQNTDFTFTDFISLSTINASSLKQSINLAEWNDIWSASQLMVKLEPGVQADQVNAQLEAFSKRHFGPEHQTEDFIFIPSLQPLSDLHFNTDYRDNFSRQAHLPTLYALMGVAALILLLAAINFINLATAQAVRRAGEMGIRKALGGSRLSLLGQFLGETLLVATLALGLSMWLVPQVLVSFSNFIPAGVVWQPLQLQNLAFMGLLLLAVTLLSGLYPAWVLSSYQPALALKGQRSSYGDGRTWLRKGLIIFQFTFSLVLINGALVIKEQMDYIRQKDLGFSSDAVVLVNTPRDERSVLLAQKMRQLAGVDRVTLQWFPPLGEGYMVTKVKYQGGKEEKEVEASAKVGDEHFIPLYELDLVAGRNFGASDTMKELVINERFVHELGFEKPADALGQLLNFNGQDYPIAGVVADFHEQSFHEPIDPAFIGYIPGLAKDLAIKLSTADKSWDEVQHTLAGLAQAWASLYPEQKFVYQFMDDTITKIYEREHKTAQLLHWATAIAIFISCMGLLGLITFIIEQRTKEIGIRKVLGASVPSITGLLAKDFLVLVLVAIVLATPVAYYLAEQWLADFAFRVQLSWWVFAVGGLAALSIALFTISAQSIRAALADPVKSLRSE